VSFVELFRGIGGFRLGLERCRWKCVWSNDIDKYSTKVYRSHFGSENDFEGDIREVDAKQIPDHTLLTGGFPCQSFSVAGKRKGLRESRGTLFTSILRIASAKRPKLLLLENVKGLLSSDNGRTFAIILRALDGLGYDVEWQVLNSKYFGVPQNRERVFIVGHSREASSKQIFPIGEVSSDFAEAQEAGGHTNALTSGYSQSNSRGNYIISDRTRTKAGLGRNLESPKEETNALSSVQKDNLVLSVELAYTKANMKNGRFSEVCHSLDGGNSKGVSIITLPHGYNLGWEKPLPHIGSHQGRPYNELLKEGSSKIRRLTPVECERLQGFPDGWTEGVSDTQRYKLLGNAVTVNVIQFLGERLSDCSV